MQKKIISMLNALSEKCTHQNRNYEEFLGGFSIDGVTFPRYDRPNHKVIAR